MRTLTRGQACFLDLCRYLAASMIFLHHCLLQFHHQYVFRRYTDHLGAIGVGIFFVLSGFLIAYSVHRKSYEREDYSFTTYLLERFVRVYIVLVPAVALVAACDRFLIGRLLPGRDATIGWNVLTTVLPLTGFVGFGKDAAPLQSIPGLRQVWTLTYEVCLYFIYGVVLLYREGAGWKRYVKAGALGGAVLFLSRFPDALLMSFNWLAGVIVFHGFQKGIACRRRAVGAGVLVAATVAAVAVARLAAGLSATWRQWLNVILITAVFAAALWTFAAFDVGARLSAAARFLASYSYSMYLVHFIVLFVAFPFLFPNSGPRSDASGRTVFVLAALFLGVNAFSWMFSLATERNTQRVRSRLTGWLQRRSRRRAAPRRTALPEPAKSEGRG